MTIKNIFSMTPGECKVAEKLMEFEWYKKYDCQVAFPVKDVGIDLFIIRRIEDEGERAIGVQVKESRDYRSTKGEPRPFHSWHGVNKNDFTKPFTRRPDFYVFVYYKETSFGRKIMFKDIYIIVPYSDLYQKVQSKKATGKVRTSYDFYFSYDEQGRKLEEWRDDLEDYTKYYNAWDLVRSGLGIP